MPVLCSQLVHPSTADDIERKSSASMALVHSVPLIHVPEATGVPGIAPGHNIRTQAATSLMDASALSELPMVATRSSTCATLGSMSAMSPCVHTHACIHMRAHSARVHECTECIQAGGCMDCGSLCLRPMARCESARPTRGESSQAAAGHTRPHRIRGGPGMRTREAARVKECRASRRCARRSSIRSTRRTGQGRRSSTQPPHEQPQ